MIYPPIDLRHTSVWTLFPPFRSLNLPTLGSTVITRFLATVVDSATCGPSRCSRALKALPHQYFHPGRASQASQVQSHVSANSPISITPVHANSWIRQFDHLSAIACWISHSIGTHKKTFSELRYSPFRISAVAVARYSALGTRMLLCLRFNSFVAS